VAKQKSKPKKQDKVKKTRRGRGEGSVFYDEAKGCWVGVAELPPGPDGKRRRRKRTGSTKAEVLERLRKLQDQAESGHLPEVSQLTVKQYLDHWLELKKSKVAPATVQSYDRDCRLYLVPHLGRMQLSKLVPVHVERLYQDLTVAGVSAAMQRKAGVTLRVALQHAVYPGKLLVSNPAAAVKKPRHEPEEMQVLDPDQVVRFLDAARPDRLHALYVVAIDSAARPGELFALLWSDVDFDGGAIRIIRSLEEISGRLRVKDLKTKKSRRRVALASFSMEALAEHRKRMLAEGNYRPDGLVFCDTLGGWLRKSNFLRTSFQKVLARANAKAAAEAKEQGTEAALLPKVRPYDMRHTGATLLLLAGESPKVVSERLGHSTTAQTMDTYSHVLPGMQERAAAKLDAIFRARQMAAPSKTTVGQQ
jgi:integrase